ncbi:MAG: radical SAM/SPASM domain-containing protein [bacterium]
MGIKDIDSHKLNYHPERVAQWKSTGFCYPLHMEVGITNECNHRCKQCTLDWINHGQDSLDAQILVETLKEASSLGVKSVYFAGEGEPTLHRALGLFARTAHDLGIKVALSTNGSCLSTLKDTLPYLSWLRFSVDAATAETFSKIHRVELSEFDKVISNIKQCVDVVKNEDYKVQIGIQSLLMPENINEIEPLANIAKNIGAHNFQVKPAHCHPKSSYQITPRQHLQDGMQQRLEKLNSNTFTTIVRIRSLERLGQPRTYNECHAFNFYCLIDACGNLSPCNVFYGKDNYIFGNIYKDSLQEIWSSDKKRIIIKQIAELKHSLCKDYRCRQDVMNRYLERVKNPEINDEFI